ncbi:MAG TPA: DUF1287 domain-containing protein [Blastocatellia bacterium]|nr:DUF1287 domain-containing protein [Blastocatellia bacterium]
MILIRALPVLFLALSSLTGCQEIRGSQRAVEVPQRALADAMQVKADATPLEKINAGAIEQTTQTTGYDASYVKLDYPNGDVPLDTGVCADVVVRAFRKGGIDLQKELHEDMKKNFAKYPRKWGLHSPDANIDHRRVPNLMTWFDRQSKSQPITKEAKDYLPGDVVAWDMTPGLPHIGIVSKIKVEGTERYAVVHNIGLGARIEDVLFAWKITGHYRYFEYKKEDTTNKARPGH